MILAVSARSEAGPRRQLRFQGLVKDGAQTAECRTQLPTRYLPPPHGEPAQERSRTDVRFRPGQVDETGCGELKGEVPWVMCLLAGDDAAMCGHPC